MKNGCHEHYLIFKKIEKSSPFLPLAIFFLNVLQISTPNWWMSVDDNMFRAICHFSRKIPFKFLTSYFWWIWNGSTLNATAAAAKHQIRFTTITKHFSLKRLFWPNPSLSYFCDVFQSARESSKIVCIKQVNTLLKDR